ncbi:hypothetical protein ACQYAD_11630 [Neobacillus sp. SM06]|uniref:hypothetical protein n=1 Tax=Neobacillus sp. SM06 TaxID=3422492 RepID=UPI003D2A415E
MVKFRLKKKKNESKGKKMAKSVVEEAGGEIIETILAAGIKGILRFIKHLLNVLQ